MNRVEPSRGSRACGHQPSLLIYAGTDHSPACTASLCSRTPSLPADAPRSPPHPPEFFPPPSAACSVTSGWNIAFASLPVLNRVRPRRVCRQPGRRLRGFLVGGFRRQRARVDAILRVELGSMAAQPQLHWYRHPRIARPGSPGGLAGRAETNVCQSPRRLFSRTSLLITDSPHSWRVCLIQLL